MNKKSINKTHKLECYWDGELTSIYESTDLDKLDGAKRMDIDESPLGTKLEYKLIKANDNKDKL